MILILSSEDDLHVKSVISHLAPDSFRILDLKSMGHTSFLDFDPETNEAEISFRQKENSVFLTEITAVWYRRPKYKRGEEGVEEWKRKFAEDEERRVFDGLWESLSNSVVWLNNPFANRAAERKLKQLHMAKVVGFDIPPTLVTNNPKSLQAFAKKHGEIVYKPLSRSHVERPNDIPLVFLTKIINGSDLAAVLPRATVTPSLFQKYIKKQFELRVTVVGNKIFATAQHSQEDIETIVDWRRNPIKVRHERINLPKKVERACRKILEALSLTFGAIDLIFTPEGRFVFLEINPNGQWLWIEDFVGYPISSAIAEVLQKGEKDVR